MDTEFVKSNFSSINHRGDHCWGVNRESVRVKKLSSTSQAQLCFFVHFDKLFCVTKFSQRWSHCKQWIEAVFHSQAMFKAKTILKNSRQTYHSVWEWREGPTLSWSFTNKSIGTEGFYKWSAFFHLMKWKDWFCVLKCVPLLKLL